MATNIGRMRLLFSAVNL